MADIPDIIRIFIPSCAFECDSCVFLGWKSPDEKVQCITKYIELNNHDAIAFPDKIDGLQVLGVWDNVLHNPNLSSLCQKWTTKIPGCVRMVKTNSELPECTLSQGRCADTEIVVVVFDAKDLDGSSLLEVPAKVSNLGLLYHGWQTCVVKKTLSKKGVAIDAKTFIPIYRSLRDRMLDCLKTVMIQFCLLLSKMILTVCDSQLCNMKLCLAVPKPAALLHVIQRARHIDGAVKLDQHRPKIKELRLTNLLCKLLLDLTLGLGVMYLLLAGEHTAVVADTVMAWAQMVASELQRLLQWMMGVPAGLKLNHELAHFLGQFFLYHIYLWTGYLQYLAPLWKDAVWYIAVSGCLGLSFQLSLIQDLLSLMTLHSYCFYVYAARLYSLQVYGLMSLWRLFRGKKWNPLFQRVDSSSYDVDQLFIGTLLFTILLFLLPTTGLFYIVFTALRLVMLAIQGILYKCVSLLDSLPLYLVFVRVFTPRIVAGDVRLHVLPRLPNRPLYHALQLLPVPFSQLLEHANGYEVCSDNTSYTWGSLINKIVSGHLIYPWIRTSSS